MRVFVGDDWSEKHHDVEVVAADGRVLARRKLSNDSTGLARLHAVIAESVGEPDSDDEVEVLVGIETDQGPWVAALYAAGYQVYAINPLMVARYRERHQVSGAKSDPGDAHVLAEIVRLDASHHRLLHPASPLAQRVKITARTHKSLIWQRQRQSSALRALLLACFPAAVALWNGSYDRDAVAILSTAPTKAAAAKLTQAKIRQLLVKAGRRRYRDVAAAKIHQGLRQDLGLPVDPQLEPAYAAAVQAQVAVIAALNTQIEQLEQVVAADFGQHPDADIILSQPGLGTVLGARVLAEFGDAADAYPDAKARCNYAGCSPVTKRSGTKIVIHARYARNDRLADALFLQAEKAISVSPGAKAYYQARVDRGASHSKAVRAVSNRLVKILHGCLKHRTVYDETTAWRQHLTQPENVAA